VAKEVQDRVVKEVQDKAVKEVQDKAVKVVRVALQDRVVKAVVKVPHHL
jgi:hypothetical protein